METSNRNRININVSALLEVLRKDKKTICLYCIISAVIGTIVAFSIPKIYKTSVMLAPETSNSNSLTSNISSLASMVGMDMQFGNGSDAIYPEIYPDLMKSTDFIVSLFPVKVTTKDGKVKGMQYYEYLKTKQKAPWWTYPFTKMSEAIKNMSSNKDKFENNTNKVDPFRLTKDQYDIAQEISGNINCSVDKKTSVISIEVTDQDPLVCASMADSVKKRLQVFITNYRTNKARNDLKYMEKLFNEAKAQYTKSRQLYATFSDANQDLILETVKAKQEDMENEMQLRYNIYTQVAEQLQLSKAKVQERTPAFTVVQSASVPIKHSNKPKVFTMLTFVFIALVLRVIILMFKKRDVLFSK